MLTTKNLDQNAHTWTFWGRVYLDYYGFYCFYVHSLTNALTLCFICEETGLLIYTNKCLTDLFHYLKCHSLAVEFHTCCWFKSAAWFLRVEHWVTMNSKKLIQQISGIIILHLRIKISTFQAILSIRFLTSFVLFKCFT